MPAPTTTFVLPMALHPHVAARSRIPRPITLHPNPARTRSRNNFNARRRRCDRNTDVHANRDLRRSGRGIANAGQRKANACNKGQFAGHADHGCPLSMTSKQPRHAACSSENAVVFGNVDVIAFACSGISRITCDPEARLFVIPLSMCPLGGGTAVCNRYRSLLTFCLLCVYTCDVFEGLVWAHKVSHSVSSFWRRPAISLAANLFLTAAPIPHRHSCSSPSSQRRLEALYNSEAGHPVTSVLNQAISLVGSPARRAFRPSADGRVTFSCVPKRK